MGFFSTVLIIFKVSVLDAHKGGLVQMTENDSLY